MKKSKKIMHSFIDCKLLRKMFVGAFNYLSEYKSEINCINFFPVHDCDTGTNMMLTMDGGIQAIKDADEKISINELLVKFTEGLFNEATGNSGNILCQFFQSFIIEERKQIYPADLVKIFNLAQKKCYESVQYPQNGTILTIIKDIADALIKKDYSNAESIENCFDFILEVAQQSLNKTKDENLILKKNNCVDSGGSGLLYILKGMHKILMEEK